MFVDASALVAILTGELEGRALAHRLQSVAAPITSPVAVYEAVLAMKRKRQTRIEAIRAEMRTLLEEAGITLVPITPEDTDRALIAHGRYGKGTGHPARLSMGDCFAYAVAEGRGVGLPFKGEDFALTDLGGP